MTAPKARMAPGVYAGPRTALTGRVDRQTGHIMREEDCTNHLSLSNAYIIDLVSPGINLRRYGDADRSKKITIST